MDLLKCLAGLGLSGYEARVLRALASEGSSAAKPLSEKSGVPMGMIYSTLSKLREKGLVDEVPGKARRFSALPAEEMKERLRAAREKRISEARAGEEALLSELGRALPKSAVRDVRVRYFSSAEEYFSAYVEAESGMGENETVKAILPIRPFHALLEKELAKQPAIPPFLGKTSRKRGPDYLCLTNADALASSALETLGNGEDAARSLERLVAHARKSGKWVYRSRDIAKTMVVFILRDRVFFEFYSGDSTRFISGLELGDENAAKDFSAWFDQLFGEVRDRKEALRVFEKRLSAAARKKRLDVSF